MQSAIYSPAVLAIQQKNGWLSRADAKHLFILPLIGARFSVTPSVSASSGIASIRKTILIKDRNLGIDSAPCRLSIYFFVMSIIARYIILNRLLYICCIYLYLHSQIALISNFYKPKFIRLSLNTIPHFFTHAIKSSKLSISHGKDRTFLPPEYTSTRSNHFVHLTRVISSLDQQSPL